MLKNVINWFEIPAKDINRAMNFYKALFSVDELQQMDLPEGGKMAMLPFDMQAGGIGGGVVQAKGYEPSDKGTTVFLNAGEDLKPMLDRVEPAGGKIVLDKMNIGEYGFMAYFMDTEGNKVALHSLR